MIDEEDTLVRAEARPPERRRRRVPYDLGPRYEHLEHLGEGAFGEVHRVLDRRLGRVVAMKVLRAEHANSELDLARFVDEAQAAAQLQHPAIVPVYDLDYLPDGRPFFTMREVSGRSLARLVHQAHQSLDPDDPLATIRPLVDALRRAAEAIGYAHRLGLIHRDLKPSNVLLDADGALWVVDWGLAKVVEERGVALTGRQRKVKTMAGTLLGTPSYMSPEQAQGRVAELDARADTYALGAILYHILCGKPPYHGKIGMSAAIAVVTGPPEPVASLCSWPVPEALVACCERAMARVPDDRFPTAVELADALAVL